MWESRKSHSNGGICAQGSMLTHISTLRYSSAILTIAIVVLLTPASSQDVFYKRSLSRNSIPNGHQTEHIPHGAASLAFVFDITGSMYDDLVQVIEGAAKILATTLARREKPLYNYVLVPFHDPDIGPVTVTTSPTDFQRDLRDLYVQGGGDCPEMTIGAIKTALEVSLPNSFVYVFTDARSKDYHLTENVLTLIQNKQSQVVFVMTGDCGNNSHAGYKAYEQIASTSSGQIFLLKKSQVNQVLNFVVKAVQSRKVNLMSIDRDDGDEQILEIPIDSKLQQLTVALSGPHPVVTIIDPDGIVHNADTGLETLLDIKNAFIVNMKDPKPGVWKMKVASSGKHMIRVTGISSLDFVHGFSRKPTFNLTETNNQPIQGVPAHLFLNATDLNKSGRMTRLEVVDIYGGVITEFPLSHNESRNWMTNISQFMPPEEFFYLRVHGIDDFGFHFMRTTPTALSAIPPTPPIVTMPPRTRGFYDTTATLTCAVDSLVPFSVQWYRNGEKLGNEFFFSDPSNVSWAVPDASSFSEGTYTCNATNAAGNTIADTYLDVKDPPPTLLKPANVSAVPGHGALLTCVAFSTVDFNITWHRANSVRNISDWDKATLHSNGSLELNNIAKSDEGPFICRASNEGGYVEESLWLLVEKAPTVGPLTGVLSFERGGMVNLTCNAEAYPKPTFVWKRHGEILKLSDKVLFDNDGHLTLLNASRDDAGEYVCEATNVAGVGTNKVNIEFIEKPTVVEKRMTVLVNNGDTATITCHSTGIPAPEIRWYRDGVELEELSFMQMTADGELIILGTQDMDAGEYRCVATNAAGKDEGIRNVEVGSSPLVTRSPESVGVDILRNLTLPCSAHGLPTPTITWHRAGIPVVMEGRVSQKKDGSLFIRELQKEDEGMYTCHLENQFGSQDVSAFVTVTGIVRPLIGYGNSQVETIEGRTVQLSCLVLLGNPRPKVMWFKMGEFVRPDKHIKDDGDGNLVILDTQISHEGEYTCVASNVGGNDTFVTNLDVQVPPTIKDTGEKDLTVTQGHSITLPCEVSGEPEPQISWTKNGVRVSEADPHYFINADGSLQIFSADPRDTATYSCTAINIAGSDDKRVTLFVQTPPQITDQQFEFKVIVNSPVQLPCEAIGIPAPKVVWYKDDVQLSKESSDDHIVLLPNGALRFNTALVNDEGMYECVASSVAGNDTKHVNLIVQVPPKITSDGPTDMTVIAGEEVIIVCETEGDPRPTINWRKDLVKVDFFDPDLKYMMKETGSLLIPKVDVSDTARFLCIAENPAGLVTKEFNLIVHEPPTLPGNLANNTSAMENQRVVLPCPARGTPTPVVRWYRSGEEVTGSDIGVRVLSDGSLQLDHAQVHHAGQYVCEATNVAGNLSHLIDLLVFMAPRFFGEDLGYGGGGGDRVPENPQVIQNHTIRLRCRANAIPPPQITWFKNGRELRPEHLGDKIQVLDDGQELAIQSAGADDTARYTCVASNLAGETEKHFDLDVLVIPTIDEDTVSNHNLSVISDRSVVIDCPALGIPIPDIVWLKNGQELYTENDPNIRLMSGGRRLEVLHAGTRHSGNYSCIAKNRAGTIERDFRLDVWVPARIDGSEVVSHPEVIVNKTITLFCPASGIPIPEVYWLLGDEPIEHNTSALYILDNGWKLRLEASEVGDTARYSCHAKNVAGESEKYFDLSVLVPPYIDRTDLDTNPRVHINRTIIINCPVSGIPAPDIVWLRNTEYLDPLTHPTIQFVGGGRQLRINNAQVTDTAAYQCLVINKAGDDTVEFKLEVHVPVTIDRIGLEFSHKVIENRSRVLDCPAIGIPLPEIRWLKNGEPIDHTTHPNLLLLEGGRQLRIRAAKVPDSGLYECRAENEAGSDQISYDIVVQVPPYIDEVDSSPNHIEVTVNRTQIIDCSVHGIPPPAITWLAHGEPVRSTSDGHYRTLSEGRQLEIFRAGVPDTGRYTCIATNDAGVADRDFDLDVLVPPYIDSTNLDAKPKVVKGKTILLNCPAMGIPFPNVTWKRDGKKVRAGDRIRILLSGRQLEIFDAKVYDSAKYTCTASNSAGDAHRDFNLDVLVPPSIDDSNIVDSPRVNMNRTVVLECDVAGIPPPKISWRKNGAPLELTKGIELVSEGRILQLERVQVSDTAMYTCTATNEAGELTRNFDLEVYSPPTIEGANNLEVIEVVQNRTVYINCQADGVPQPSILWIANGVPLLDWPYANIRELSSGRQLELRNVQLADEGDYKCQANNPAGQAEKTFKLKVLVPPRIPGGRGTTELKVIKRRGIRMVCEPTGDPEPDIIWLKDGEEINPSKLRHVRMMRGNRILQIVATKLEDTGTYLCRATNVAGQDQHQYSLTVHVPPKINGSRQIEEQSVVVGESTFLDCPASGVPEPTIRWQRAGETFSYSTSPSLRVLQGGRRLQVLNAQMTDLGGYTCVASNVAGNVSKEYLLSIIVPPTIEEDVTKVPASMGSRAVLSCKMFGLPDPIVTWEKEGKPLPAGGGRYRIHRVGSLEFSSVQKKNAGKYRCIAKNPAGSVYRDVELIVQVRPELKHKGVRRLTAIAGRQVELPCEATGFPKPRIIWQKEHRVISSSKEYAIQSNGSLIITKTNTRDSAIYICRVQNNAGIALGQVVLEVQVPPSIETQQTEFTVVEDRELVLPCRANGRPTPKISWEKDGFPISMNDFNYRIPRSGWLVIPITRTENAGSYTCIAENPAGKDSIEMDLVVHVPPSIEATERFLIVTEGNEAILPCQSSGFPEPEISWIQDGRTVIHSGGRYIINDAGSLVITVVEDADTGSYVCTAKNKAGRDSKEVHLRVQVPPEFTFIPQDQEVMANGRIELECAADGVPTPTVTWRINNTDIPSPSSVNGRSRLLIDNAMKRDDGTYMCVAKNPAGQRFALAAVRIKVPPRVLLPDINHAVSLAERIVLHCPVEAGDPPPTILWMKDDIPVTYDSRVQHLRNGSLAIYDATNSDAGEYKCIATNDAGTSEGSAMLVVKTPPEFNIEPRSQTVEQGEMVMFNCDAEGEPQPEIIWKKDGAILETANRLTILPNNSLRLLISQLDDSGTYICQASNSLGSVLVKAELTVQVPGHWSSWSSWSQCSTTCGTGSSFRTRSCDNPEPANGGRACAGSGRESKMCIPQECPVDGGWGDWSTWEQCSTTCDTGERSRTRDCNNPPARYGGKTCSGESVEKVVCNIKPCPVDGAWSLWADWGACSALCGSGTQERFRRCDSPRSEHGGQQCRGSDTDRRSCQQRDCQTHGSWGDWADWTRCTLSCGGGTRSRTRNCDSPVPAKGGRYCSGNDLQIDYCNKEDCPIHGGWNDWGVWGDCTMTCGGGQRRRFRTCTNPQPKHNGRPCLGGAQLTSPCNMHNCEVDGLWSTWGQWSRCTQTCDGGTQRRARVCQRPLFGGHECMGDDTQARKCSIHSCVGGFPRLARGNIVGNINNQEFGLSRLFANITRTGSGTKITGMLIDVPREVGKHLQHLLSLMTPIYWTTATEVGEAINGYTLTQGNFRREVQVEFATGEVLYMTHLARGLDQDGILQIDVIVRGAVPDLPDTARITLLPYVENYIQTGPDSIYAFSSRIFRINGHTVPYAWNHTITYDGEMGRMPYLVQRLATDDLFVDFDVNNEILQYQVTASISKGDPSNQCPSGFLLDQEGPYCKDDNECSRENLCTHRCSNTLGSFICTCPPGFSLSADGRVCKDQNECELSSPCSHSCLNGPGSFKCACPPGQVVGDNSFTCEDVDECDLGLVECHDNQDCVNTIGSFQCVPKCREGYTRNLAELNCEDVDECAEHMNLCDHECRNTIGAYDCHCRPGYELLGDSKCIDVDECVEGRAQCSHQCLNTRGSYKCLCPAGFTLVGNRSCRDINECSSGHHTCGADQECRNTMGGYSCVNMCPKGFTKAHNGSCTDVNECETGDHMCHYNQLCMNTPGTYSCACPRGYRTEGRGRPCVDLNECNQVPSPCSYRCHNLLGSYECICPPGQKLLADKKSCAGLQFLAPGKVTEVRGHELRPPVSVCPYKERGQPCPSSHSSPQCPHGYHLQDGHCQDIDECRQRTRCQHACQNTPGTYRCTCPSGYRLSRNKRTCQDVNECTDLAINCGPNKRCFNRRGDFECVDTHCPPLYDRDEATGYCVLTCDKSRKPCPVGARYADILEFRMVALPNGIPAFQDLIRLIAYDQYGVHLPETNFLIVKNDLTVPFGIRLEMGKGVVFTLKPLEQKHSYKIKVKATSYDHRRRGIQYETTFMIYISVSMYPY